MQDEAAQISAALARITASSSDFDLNAHTTARQGILRPAAVLVPIAHTENGAVVVLTKRASHLAHHPGQISFPGGKSDPQDRSPTDTALREAREEIGLDGALVQIMGAMPVHKTVTGFAMTPVVGILPQLPAFTPDPAEVDEVFTLPLAFLRHGPNFRIESRHWQGQPRYFYTIPYGPYYIWGATARVLYSLAKGLSG